MHRVTSHFTLLACVLLTCTSAANAWENSGRIENSSCKVGSWENSGSINSSACEANLREISGRNIPLYASSNERDSENRNADKTAPLAASSLPVTSNEVVLIAQQYPNGQQQFQQGGLQPVQPQYPAGGQFQPQFTQQGAQQFQQQPYGQYQQQGQQAAAPNMVPAQAGGNGFINLNTGRFGKLDFNILGGRFQDSSVDNLRVVASDLDMARGQLGGLDVQVSGGHFKDFTIDQLRIVSSGALMFSPGAFLNNRVLDFTQPISANVAVVFTQKSLNQFLSSPESLQMLSSGATNHLGGFLSQIVGSALQVKFQSAAVQLMPENRIQTDVNVLVNLMSVETAVPLSLSTRLLLQDGWISMADTSILTSGKELPPEMASMIVTRLNKIADWGKNNPDLRFSFNQLKVYPGDRLELGGTAFIKRLRFGN